MVKIVISNAKRSNVKMMSDLNTRSLSENYDLDFWYSIFDIHKKHCFVAISSGLVIGYVLANDNNIMSFAIDEKYRHKGIGKMLLYNYLNTITQDATLKVRVDNENAIKLYKSLGFVEDHIIEDYYQNPTISAIHMVRKYDNKKYITNNKLNVVPDVIIKKTEWKPNNLMGEIEDDESRKRQIEYKKSQIDDDIYKSDKISEIENSLDDLKLKSNM